jgi:hypothetical protein
MLLQIVNNLIIERKVQQIGKAATFTGDPVLDRLDNLITLPGKPSDLLKELADIANLIHRPESRKFRFETH